MLLDLALATGVRLTANDSTVPTSNLVSKPSCIPPPSHGSKLRSFRFFESSHEQWGELSPPCKLYQTLANTGTKIEMHATGSRGGYVPWILERKSFHRKKLAINEHLAEGPSEFCPDSPLRTHHSSTLLATWSFLKSQNTLFLMYTWLP